MTYFIYFVQKKLSFTRSGSVFFRCGKDRMMRFFAAAFVRMQDLEILAYQFFSSIPQHAAQFLVCKFDSPVISNADTDRCALEMCCKGGGLKSYLVSFGSLHSYTR